MTTPDSKPPSAGKDETQAPNGRKTAASAGTPPQEPSLRCPRCDSSNTKFCYYNNYSLTQPRHFCKTCRRYWTKGGALRSVPIGGGCRKTKKTKPSAGSKDSGGPSGIGGLKFFQGISPAMEYRHLGGGIGFRGGLSTSTGQLSSLDNSSNTCGVISSNPSFGLDPTSFVFKNAGAGFQEMSSLNNGLTSSIESLSSINQDLHWKLQRQRLAMLFVGDNNNNNNNNQKENNNDYALPNIGTLVQKPQPISFQSLDISQKPEITSNNNNHNNISLSTEWFFDNSYATVNPTPSTSGGDMNDDTSNWASGIQDLY